MRPPAGDARRVTPWALAWGCIPLACSSGEAAAPSFDALSLSGAGARDAGLDGPGEGAIHGANVAPEYLAAESVIRTQCAFVRCHGGEVRGGAGLWYGQDASIRGPLVNVPACEYDMMMRVKPGDVANSWIVTKLEASQDPQTHAIDFTPQPGWVQNPACGLPPGDAGGRFGLRMPMTTFQLDSDSIAKLTAWIAAGAPGPD
jgi:hypothetical protein